MVEIAWKMALLDRKSTRLNSSHEWISYAVFCLKKNNTNACPPYRGVEDLIPAPPAPQDTGARRPHNERAMQSGKEALNVVLFFFLKIRPPPKSPLFPLPAAFRF